MNRFSMQPMCYASIDDLQRALLVQMRRFNRACSERATAISLSGPAAPRQVATPKDDAAMGRLDLLHSQLTLLRNMAIQVHSTFGTDPKAAGLKRQVDQLVRLIEERFDAFQKDLSVRARSRVGADAVRSSNALARDLQADLRLKPEQASVQFFVASVVPPGGATPAAADVAYIRLRQVRDEDGYANPVLLVAVAFPRGYVGGETGPSLIDRSRTIQRTGPDGAVRTVGGRARGHIYVAVSTEFRVPLKVRWDNVINNVRDLKAAVRSLLEAHGVIGSSTHREIPVPHESVVFDHNNVKSSRVVGNVVEVRVRNPKLIRQTEVDLRAQLQAIVRGINPRNRDVIRDRVMPEAGIIRFVFSLPGRLKGRVVSPQALQTLRNSLQLSDAELQRMRAVLEDHEQ